MNAPSERDIKILFARSKNQCAYPNCSEVIVQPSGTIAGEICHIKARSSKWPRFDETQTDNQRHAYDNLILLCRNHHKIVDSEPEKYTVELLKEFKEMHERNGNNELTQEDVRRARKLLDSYLEALRIELKQSTINQIASGHRITQVAGDYHYYEKPPKPKVMITPAEGAVSLPEQRQINTWIESLVESTVGMSKSAAFGMWRNRFKHRFGLTRSEQLLSIQMPDAEAWYRQQLAILKRGWKTKAPDAWRNARYAAIHIAIKQMGVDKLTYYAEIARRLKMKKPFTSLTELTKIDLERAYTMGLRDARGE